MPILSAGHVRVYIRIGERGGFFASEVLLIDAYATEKRYIYRYVCVCAEVGRVGRDICERGIEESFTMGMRKGGMIVVAIGMYVYVHSIGKMTLSAWRNCHREKRSRGGFFGRALI